MSHKSKAAMNVIHPAIKVLPLAQGCLTEFISDRHGFTAMILVSPHTYHRSTREGRKTFLAPFLRRNQNLTVCHTLLIGSNSLNRFIQRVAFAHTDLHIICQRFLHPPCAVEQAG